MKVIFYLLPMMLTCSCGADTTQNEAEQSEVSETNSDSLIETIVEEKAEFDSLGRYYNTDWEEQNLIGKVKSMSLYGVVLEDGEELIMTNYYEDISFNENGFQATEEVFGSGGMDPQINEYVYNDAGILTHRILYYLDENGKKAGEYEYKEKYFYNDEDVLVKIKMAGFDQELAEEMRFKYDDKGRMIEKEYENVQQQKVYVRKYKYKENQEIITAYKADGTEDNMSITTFDEEGNEKSLELIAKDYSYIEKFNYEFDSKGNWTSKESTTKYINADGTEEEWQKTYRSTRTITYFE